jgi:hypothetical protein
VTAGACAFEALVWTRERIVRDTLVTIGCAAIPMVSPLGLNYWPHSLMTVSVSKALELQEYRMPLDPGDIPFWIAVVVLIASVVIQRCTTIQRLLGYSTRATRGLSHAPQ